VVRISVGVVSVESFEQSQWRPFMNRMKTSSQQTMRSSRKKQPEKGAENGPPEDRTHKVFHGSQKEFLQSFQPGDKLEVKLPE